MLVAYRSQEGGVKTVISNRKEAKMRERNLSALGLSCLPLVLVMSLFMVLCAEVGAAEILHLGATVPFQSRIGIQLKNILNMNADLLNKTGGLTVGGKTYTIKYHIYDDKYNADAGRAAIEKLVFEDKIKFNVGTLASAPALAMLSVTEANKIPIFSGAVSQKLLNPNVKYFVHTYPQIGPAIGNALRKLRPDMKTVLLCSSDDETGHTVLQMFEKMYKSFGLTTFAPLYFKHGQTDFSGIATELVALKPDHFSPVAIAVEAEYIQLIKAVRESGYKGTIECHYLSQQVLDNILARVGKKGAEGIYVVIGDPTLPDITNKPPEAMEFRKNYETYYGKWEPEGLQWAGCWYTWLAAVKKADSLDPDKVMAAIDKDFKVSTPSGPAKFFRRPDLGNNRYCDIATVIRMGVIKDGKIVLVFEGDADYMIRTAEDFYKIK